MRVAQGRFNPIGPLNPASSFEVIYDGRMGIIYNNCGGYTSGGFVFDVLRRTRGLAGRFRLMSKLFDGGFPG